MDEILEQWRGWRFKNTLLLLLGIALFYLLAQTPQVANFIRELGYLGRLGALLAGFFFVSTYTVIPAGYVLFELGKYQSPLEVAAFAGVGAMIGDYVIFRFIRDRVMDEIKPYLAKVGTPKVRRLFRTPYFAWSVPVIGALIIASPLPDELGVSLMGASKMKNAHFMIVTYLLNTAGIFVVVLLGASMK
jgi:uncharacterized membrane protein YdjX (TVP38/TMEM64 family)